MNKKLNIIVLVLILLSLPSISLAYPLDNLTVREFPDKFIAGNTHHTSFSFDNNHDEPVKVRFVLNISNINEYSELDMSARLNNEPINITQTDPGRFSSGIVNASVGNNIINGTLKTNIRLAPLTYKYTGLIYVENVSKPKEFEHKEHHEHYISHGGDGERGLKPGIYTSEGYTPLPTTTPTATPTENVTKPTPYLPGTPETPTPTVLVTETPTTTPNVTTTPSVEDRFDGIPGFEAVFAVMGLLTIAYLLRR